MPGHPRRQLGEVGVAAVHPQLAQPAAVAVALGAARLHLPPEHQPGQVLARRIAKGLALLRRVDAGEAHFLLALAGVEHRHRVAVRHRHHPPLDHPRRRPPGHQQQNRHRNQHRHTLQDTHGHTTHHINGRGP